LSLICAGVKRGDEVITTPFTFAASVNTILHAGAIPVFADIEPDTLNIYPVEIKKKINSKTGALIIVHYAGNSCKLDEIREITGLNGIKVIEDAAHAIGTEYTGRKIGSDSEFACFSFYANKNITTGEGGMLTTNNRELAERSKRLSLHGLSSGAWSRYEKKGTPHYEIVEPGYKYNMSDIIAAIGIHQLNKIEDLYRKRERIVNKYNENLSDVEEIDILSPPGYTKSSYYIYVIKLNLEKLSKNRDEIAQMLRDAGVGVSIHFKSIHLHQYYRERYNIKPDDFPAANIASERVLTLPLYPTMTDSEVDFVVDEVKSVIKRCRK
jgi:dTDP-4-amino-4,6-dideoxygalactose transaminase